MYLHGKKRFPISLMLVGLQISFLDQEPFLNFALSSITIGERAKFT